MRRMLVLVLLAAGCGGQIPSTRQCIQLDNRCNAEFVAPTWAERLPLVFELSPDLIRTGWGWQFLEAVGWWERALKAYDPQLPDGLMVVLPTLDLEQAKTATVWVQLGDVGPDRAGLAQREWTEDCQMRRAIITFMPDLDPRWRFALAVHEIGHVLGVEHRLDSQIMHCDPQWCGLDRSCWPLPIELQIAHQGLVGW